MARARPFLYEGEYLDKISFPLGGIGTGSIGLSGAGRLIDWEIFNRPAKGIGNGFSHFAIKAEAAGEVRDVRVLNGPFGGDLTGDHRAEASRGYGFGARRNSLVGVPHFATTSFDGRFPIARVALADPQFPGDVHIEAFNPFIPMDDRASSMPVAMFTFTLRNTATEALDYTIAAVLGHGPAKPTRVKPVDHDGLHGVVIEADGAQPDSPQFAQLAVATDAPETSRQSYLYRGLWFDSLQVYWDDFRKPGRFIERSTVPDYATGGMSRDRDHSLQAAHVHVPAGGSATVRFVIAWYVPNFEKYWTSQFWHFTKPPGSGATWRNWYGNAWPGVYDIVAEAFANWRKLAGETTLFRDTLYASTLPLATLDAVAANLSILKSPTVLRMPDGTFYGWEGLGADVGSCEGSCTHVWNYQQAVPFLFPVLERSMRALDYAHNLDQAGGMSFRLPLPVGTDAHTERPCVDGQFGNVMKLYRDWKLSGDDAWLRQLWPLVKRSIEYAWSPDNPDRWDPEKTGVLWGRQHHTLDMELFGPNSWLTGFYLGALKAGSLMAAHLGDHEAAAEYRALFDKGARWTADNLFNGAYFVQHIDLSDHALLSPYAESSVSRRLVGGNVFDLYWSDEHKELKYQGGEACLIDQVVAQWHADLYGLGDVFDRGQVAAALGTIMRYNFKPDLGEVFNPCRVFSVKGEAGTLIAAFPEQAHVPAMPVPYAQETMHGFEYSFGGALFQNGMLDDGARVFGAVRDHYDGAKRNPWNEIECGSNYARSMASWAALPILSGFTFDAHARSIGFAPRVRSGASFRSFWSSGAAWGSFELAEHAVTLRVLHGRAELARIGLPLSDQQPAWVAVNGDAVAHTIAGGDVVFDQSRTLTPGDTITVNSSSLTPMVLRDISTLTN